ncbi:hypothetical protein Forpi1262_v017194 [Fusarium oxysporum f. sp. raphani]|uniref:DUF7082 domain-containing protein n=1 Tax=Fusarium oxysporum f. sp. raphani TaxID=96318 RepID=A0A8J5P7Y9_FUSOX|nr:hypothetical protein Forpi1262_v017194 [Fusarium oxysporum f. sp. raphani]
MEISIKTEPPSTHTGYEVARYQDTAHGQDSTKAYPTQKHCDTCAPLNHQDFVSNSAAVAHNVPLSLVLDGPSGEEISRIPICTFRYLEGSGEDSARSAKIPKHEDAAPFTTIDQPSASPEREPQLPSEPGTNTYEYPPQQGQYANTLPQGNKGMQRPTAGQIPYPGTLGSKEKGPGGLDTSLVGRPPLLPLGLSSPSHSNGAPQLVRTSTITANAGNSTSYQPQSRPSDEAILKISGKLESMAENWTPEESANRRRIVSFRKTQKGSTVNTACQSVSVNERPTNSICISCIWWAEKGECYVTSVDTIHLLEQLVAAPNRFSVEEKNRIRRNLERFHPQTVSKAKPDSEEFFKIIMGFPNPKPRHIEKDLKVFPWKIFESALKKIIGKYSVDPSIAASSPTMNQSNGGHAPMPMPPGQSMTPAHPDAHTHFSLPQHHN